MPNLVISEPKTWQVLKAETNISKMSRQNSKRKSESFMSPLLQTFCWVSPMLPFGFSCFNWDLLTSRSISCSNSSSQMIKQVSVQTDTDWGKGSKANDWNTHPHPTPHFRLFTKIPTMGAGSFLLQVNINFLICLGLSDKYLEFSHTNILIHHFSKIQILFSHSALISLTSKLRSVPMINSEDSTIPYFKDLIFFKAPCDPTYRLGGNSLPLRPLRLWCDCISYDQGIWSLSRSWSSQRQSWCYFPHSRFSQSASLQMSSCASKIYFSILIVTYTLVCDHGFTGNSRAVMAVTRYWRSKSTRHRLSS